MSTTQKRIAAMIKSVGVVETLRRGSGVLYRRTLRRLLPLRSHVMYNGIIVDEIRYLDTIVPRYWRPHYVDDLPYYEDGLVRAMTEFVKPGDSVVVVGGGMGVTVAHAAALVGEHGSVVCFEGAPLYANRVRNTCALNKVSGRVIVNSKTVAADIGVYQNKFGSSSAILPPEDLPACDVLELDCEGAEIMIINNVRVPPKVILVESHGMLGTPAKAVRAALESKGYNVTDIGVAESALAEFCEKNDVRVLCGVRSQ